MGAQSSERSGLVGRAQRAAGAREFPEQKPWPPGNMFFGGVHAASVDQALKSFVGAGDPRRGGVAVVV